MSTKELSHILEALVGQRCEAIDNPIGSILLIDIGPLGPPDPDRPGVRPNSWRHLTIECPWRLQTSERVLCDWNDSNGAEGAILAAMSGLIGQRITSASATPPGWDLSLAWGSGVTLLTLSDATVDRWDAWSVLGTDGLQVGAGPLRDSGGGLEIRWTRED